MIKNYDKAEVHQIPHCGSCEFGWKSSKNCFAWITSQVKGEEWKKLQVLSTSKFRYDQSIEWHPFKYKNQTLRFYQSTYFT